MSDYTITPLVNEHCETGENPFWNPDDGCVYWTDIPKGKLFRYDPSTGGHETIYEDVPVGGFTLQENGDLLLFRITDIAALAPDGTVRVVREYTDDGMKRFNDVIADPQGRVYAGTMGVTKESGGLYRVDTDGTVTKLFAGTATANGMAFTADLRTLYWTDSTAKRIYRFRYHPESGELTDRELFYQADPEEGTPDGLTLDTEENVWSARHRGGMILKHAAADGRVLEKIPMPVPRVTSLVFGGPNLDTFYVTTGGGGAEGQDDGTLYAIQAGVRGRHEFRSRIQI